MDQQKPVNLTIDGIEVIAAPGMSLLEAAESASIKIPRLCHLAGLSPSGACGLCVVEVEGERNLTRSCVRPAQEGMVVRANTGRLRNIRRELVELLLSNHPADCFTCVRTKHCELRDLAAELGVSGVRFEPSRLVKTLDESSLSLVRDPAKCILCGRCIRVCDEVQSVGALDFANRGADLVVGAGLKRGLGEAECVNCGQCIHVCPVAAITEKSHVENVWKEIDDPTKTVVVQVAPAVRVALGEELSLSPGSLVTGKMHAAFRRLGFDRVFDTNFTADLTIMEEGSELVERVTTHGELPMLTSCCPAWIKFLETFYPDLISHLSTCKSPQQMFGALAKTYFAEEAKLDPSRIVSVSVMPCTAKKFEAQRPEMFSSGYRDVDYVLTTREAARMIREAGIDFGKLPAANPDELMGLYSGAATIFGATGGVMEAALRTAYKLVTGNELEVIDIAPLRGMEGVKVASVDVPGLKVNVAVAHGLRHARGLLEEIRAGTSPYHLIEVMACPGGCVGGGGQPLGFDMALRDLRGQGLYKEDKSLPIRKSHQNPAVERIYREYLGEPLGDRSHHLLHTKYSSRCVVPDLKEILAGQSSR